MKTPNKHRKQWTSKDIDKLKQLANGNTPTGLIAYKLKRTNDAIRAKASEEKISLKPTNKSPYDRNYSKTKKKRN